MGGRLTASTGRAWPVARLHSSAVPVLLAATLLAVSALTGCGVSAQDRPRLIASPHGPFPLPASPQPTSSAPSPMESGAVTEQLCYIRNDMLVVVSRQVATPTTPQDQIQLLLDGPSAQERNAGLTSALTGASVITGVRVQADEAIVDVAEGLAGTSRNDEVLAFGQVVCTLTSRPDVERISFQADGQPLGVPRADGSLSSGPLTVSDYASIIAAR